MINIRAPHLQNKYLNKKGFTIIEIMIVLAVASLIMLIVFLAVPALQRNARNTNRTADATKIASSVNECLSNRNNVTTSCDAHDANSQIVGVTLDNTTLRQLTTVNVNTAATSPAASPGAFPADTATANIYFRTKCGTDGSSYSAGNSQQFVVLYNNESSGGGNVNRCISG
ncbi:prepilin-type N-terminal cleavage/methylation domain-containing protein [Candidatus Saccharibacteria bacterium]|nr:prepilin-type N-terminal cleavage/methylation domain-containing protein [Candidatus Saccharibacteria bacterium]